MLFTVALEFLEFGTYTDFTQKRPHISFLGRRLQAHLWYVEPKRCNFAFSTKATGRLSKAPNDTSIAAGFCLRRNFTTNFFG